jgi:hypothetical protein
LQLGLRAPLAAIGFAGALGFAITPSAAAPAPGQADTQGAADPTSTATVQAKVADRRLRFGQRAVVSGRVGDGRRAAPVALQFRPAGTATWRTAATGRTAADGRYRLGKKLRRSGAVRVVAAGEAATAVAASAERPVRVGARLVTRKVRRHVPAGRSLRVTGEVRPGGAGRPVALQLRRDGRWRTVDRDRTSGSGRFTLRERLPGATSLPARVRFGGDRANASSERRIGRVNSYRRALASWYGPGLYGNPLGCGGRLGAGTVGVAHKTLPCGARLTLRYRGNVVRTRVIDRGPYVGAREFDLTAATKAKLGFGSTGYVQVTR